ncbi:SPFH domain-containing protein [Streptomyces sp. NPDC102451]|uniref:SPFH domain-containing protein n=1 Tax=Streptomyces sp. NPDC102451 TaxID=3366177 RepID=UPI00382CE840
MRSTENVRGEWDELGERDTRVIVPGPGVGEAQAEGAVDMAPAAEDDIPADLGPALDAVAGVGRAARGEGEGPADLDLGLDLGRGLLTEAEPEREIVFGTADPDPDPDLFPGPDHGAEPEQVPGPRVLGLHLEPEPEPEPGPPEPGLPESGLPESVLPGPVRAPEPGEPVTGATATEAEPAPDRVSGRPDLRKPEAGERPEPAGARPPETDAGERPEPAGVRPPEDGAGDEGRAPVTLTAGGVDPVAWWGAGRRQPVIATETTAPIPVHLLFRDDDQDGRLVGAGGTTAGTGTGTVRRSGERRPPLPRSRPMRAPTRPAPLADPRLTERPGPVLPGWTALFTAAAGALAGVAVLWWQGALPAAVTGGLGLTEHPYDGIGIGAWALLALVVAVALFALLGLGRGRSGHASVLTLFGDYRGSVRRTGLLWISPLLRRGRIDVRLRHWRSEPLPAVDASGTALRAVVLVVWRVKDTARAALGVADHEYYLRDQVEAALARVLSQLPADAFLEETRTLRDAEAVGDALTRMVQADCAPAGIEVYSAQPTGIEYAPEVAAAMQRCRVAAIDAKHRDGVLTSVVDAVDDTVGRLTARGIVELDAYEHKALVRDLTVAFYTGRSGREGA